LVPVPVLSSVVPDFLDYCSSELGLSPKTVDNYKRELGKLVRWGGSKRVSEIEIQQLTQYFRDEEARGLKVSSVNTARRTVRSLFYYLQHYRRVPVLFDFAMVRQKKDYGKIPMRVASTGDVEKVMAFLTDQQDKLIVATLFGAGLRISELIFLDVKDIGEGCELAVRGKGGVFRPVPITRSLHTALRNHILDHAIKSGAVFRSSEGKRYSVSGLRNRFIRKLKPHGLYPSFHWYRHGIATELYNNGADIRFVQEFLGHADIRTTQIYTHVSAERRRDVYDENFPKGFNLNKLLTQAE